MVAIRKFDTQRTTGHNKEADESSELDCDIAMSGTCCRGKRENFGIFGHGY